MTEPAVWTERLVQLRRALLRSLAALIGGGIFVYGLSEGLLAELLRHMPDGSLVFLSPAEAFVTRLKLALGGGFVLALPFVLGQVYGLAKPLLPRARRRGGAALVVVSFLLFLAGAATGYFGLLPVAMQFFLGFEGPDLKPMLAVGPYVGFVTMLVLPMGLLFQMPVAAVFLARAGVIDPGTVAGRRKWAVLVIFILSAVLTPPDVFSQLLMAAPLWVLFEVSLLAARLAVGKRKGM